MRKFFGVLIILGGALLGLWLAFYVCLFGGLVQIGTALKMADPPVVQIAGGIVRILMAGLVGWGTAVVCFSIGGLMIVSTAAPRIRRW